MKQKVFNEIIVETCKSLAYQGTAGLITLQDHSGSKGLTTDNIQAFKFGMFATFDMLGLTHEDSQKIWESILEDAQQEKILSLPEIILD